MEAKPHASALRKGRWSDPGRIYLLTTVTHQRRPIFRDLLTARQVIRTLPLAEPDATTLAYCLMPDHLHWLVELRAHTALSKVMHRIKSISAHRVDGLGELVQRRVWQPGYHDRALRRGEELIEVARYLVANPLRARLVRRLGDYPHWDAVWL